MPQIGLIRQSLHFHRPFDNLSVPLHSHRRAADRDRDDPRVHVWSQAVIKSDFVFAISAAFLQCGKVEEVQRDGLADLYAIGPAKKTTEICVWRTSTRLTVMGYAAGHCSELISRESSKRAS